MDPFYLPEYFLPPAKRDIVMLAVNFIASKFSESVRVRTLKFGTNDVYVTM